QRALVARAMGVPAPAAAAPEGPPAPAPLGPPAEPFEVAVSNVPVASIVIPVHNALELTQRCLGFIANDPALTPFEVIVVDDASTDGTAEWLATVKGVKVITNESNLGYTQAANVGIAASQGEYVVLLNNDTSPLPGWLDELVALADGDERIGIVGARLLNPDGTLQEAGLTVGRDGAFHRYGSGGDPQLSTYQHVRDVDAVSGAAMLVRRTLLDVTDGFDERYAPAFYEDIDLCFAARANGYRVVYQPKAVVPHVGAATYGEVAYGPTVHAVRGRRAFATKWVDELASQPDVPVEEDPAAPSRTRTRDHGTPPRALVLDVCVPAVDRDSGSVRMAAMIDALLELGYTVTFRSLDEIVSEPHSTRLRQRGVEVLGPEVDFDAHVRSMAPDLKVCIVSRPAVALRFIEPVLANAPDTTILFDAVDLQYRRQEREANLFDDAAMKRTALMTRELESTLVRGTHGTLAVSEEEAEMVRALVPGSQAAVFPNIHELMPAASPRGRRGLLFVGGYAHAPNRDAAAVLANEVMPLLRQRAPGMRLMLAGSAPPEEVEALAAPDIAVPGLIPDLAPVLARHRVFVAPLRYGAGVKGKVGQAFAHGIPVVTTAIGAEGMDIVDGETFLLAEDVAETVEAVLRLLSDDELWLKLSRAGQAYARRHHSAAAGRRHLEAGLRGWGVLPH
ncbi:MAG TPA: glycosyltransferase, partial [Mycobacteriales bacterium]|nr:glycosyltransferase [Mycobacteriales bacterium]